MQSVPSIVNEAGVARDAMRRRVVAVFLVCATGTLIYTSLQAKNFLGSATRAEAATTKRDAARKTIAMGLAGVFFRVANELQLTDHNPRLISLEAESEQKLDQSSLQEAFIDFRQDLSRQARNGKLDKARLERKVVIYEQADLALRREQVGAIRRLHDALTAAERARLADTVVGMQPRRPEGDPHTIEEALSRRVDGQEKQLSAALSLTEEQMKDLRVFIIRRNGAGEEGVKEEQRVNEGSRSQMDTLLAAFRANDFGGDDSLLSPIKDESVAMTKQVEFVENLLSILSATQIVKLADLLDAGSNPWQKAPATAQH